MVSSLVLSKPLSIGVNANHRFKVKNYDNMGITDVPVVRYRFSSSDWNAIHASVSDTRKCLVETIGKFNKSAHIAEVYLDESSCAVIRELNAAFSNVAVFLYVNVDDECVNGETFGTNVMSLIQGLGNVRIDRVMLKDNSSTLYTIVANKLKAELAKALGLKASNIGICSSPLSVGDNCCLTAIRARELAAKYGDTADMVLPSANHEGKNCSACGCIRYIVVNESTEAPVSKKAGTTGGNVETKSASNADEQSSLVGVQGNAKKKKSSKLIQPW